MASFIEALNWRYATKKFDATKKISEIDLEEILTAIQLSASSYGLQLYKILVITDPEIRAKLQPASWGQSQIVDASHVFVFCARTDVTGEDIDSYLNLKAEIQGLDPQNLEGYGDFMKKTLAPMPADQKFIWTSKQVYLALGNLLNICAVKGIDTCPMEGFESAKYDEILGLNDTGYSSAVVATVGYRSEDDKAQNETKVRKSKEDLFQII